MSKKYLPVAAAAEILATSADRITDWIAAGELVAVNIASKAAGKRPTWRIAETELQRFLESRQSTPALKLPPKRRATAEAVPHYFR